MSEQQGVENDASKHGPDLSTQGLPTCLCGRTFWTWRAQGVHETAANRKRPTPPESSAR